MGDIKIKEIIKETIILEGRTLAEKIKLDLKLKAERLKAERKRVPGLAVVLVGNDSASQIYVKRKEETCKAIGFYSEKYLLKEEIKEEELLELIKGLNENKKIDGILVQLPLPKHIKKQKIIEAISPEKDVDGFHPISFGRLIMGEPGFIACTPLGVMCLLEQNNIITKGKEVVIIGSSIIIGKPMAHLFLNSGATITICNRSTADLVSHTKRADIIIIAVGSPKMLKREMVKKGAIIIDVGINRVENKIVGDADFENLLGHASYLTPVPGGVGLMTVAILMENTWKAYENSQK